MRIQVLLSRVLFLCCLLVNGSAVAVETSHDAEIEQARINVLEADDVPDHLRADMFFNAIAAIKESSGSSIEFSDYLNDRSSDTQPLIFPFSRDDRFINNTLNILEEIAPVRPLVWVGIDADLNQFPETVLVFGAGGNCSGVLISDIQVLTAAHCVCSGKSSWVRFGNVSNRFVAEREVVMTSTMISNCFEDRRGRDLALLTMDSAIDVLPASVADPYVLSNVSLGTVVGFGQAEGNRPSGVKRYAEIVIVSPSCNGGTSENGNIVTDSDQYDCIPNRELVAGSPAWRSDACGGDSGGPFFDSPTEPRNLIGITSRGIPDQTNAICGDGGVYTRLDGEARIWLVSRGVQL